MVLEGQEKEKIVIYEDSVEITQAQLNVSINTHPYCDCLEVTALHNDSKRKTQSIFIKLEAFKKIFQNSSFIKDEINEHLAEHDYCDINSTEEDCTNKLMINFIISRLQFHTESNEIFLVPKVIDEINEDTGELIIICEKPVTFDEFVISRYLTKEAETEADDVNDSTKDGSKLFKTRRNSVDDINVLENTNSTKELFHPIPKLKSLAISPRPKEFSLFHSKSSISSNDSTSHPNSPVRLNDSLSNSRRKFFDNDKLNSTIFEHQEHIHGMKLLPKVGSFRNCTDSEYNYAGEHIDRHKRKKGYAFGVNRPGTGIVKSLSNRSPLSTWDIHGKVEAVFPLTETLEDDFIELNEKSLMPVNNVGIKLAPISKVKGKHGNSKKNPTFELVNPLNLNSKPV